MAFSEYVKKYEDAFKTAMDKSDALGPGIQVGRIFGINVADGQAYYEITKIGKKTVQVKWRKDLSLDGYQDWQLGTGGSVKIDKIMPKIEWQDRIKAMRINR